MSRLSEKALGSILTQARLRAAGSIPELAERPSAVIYLIMNYDYFQRSGLSEQTMKNYELGDRDPKPLDIVYFADAYNAPELLHQHCQNCAVGKLIHNKLEIKTLEQVALQTRRSTTGIDQAIENLLDIAADGVISEDERPIFEQILSQMRDAKQRIIELEVLAKKNGFYV